MVQFRGRYIVYQYIYNNIYIVALGVVVYGVNLHSWLDNVPQYFGVLAYRWNVCCYGIVDLDLNSSSLLVYSDDMVVRG